jgi:hypothetical protein
MGELLASRALESVTGDGITVTYAPFEGRRTSLDLAGFEERFDVRVPDLFWLRAYGSDAAVASVFALRLRIRARRSYGRSRTIRRPSSLP